MLGGPGRPPGWRRLGCRRPPRRTWAGTARAVSPGQRLGLAGPAALERVGGQVKEHLAGNVSLRGCTGPARAAPRRCQRRGRARRAGRDGQLPRPRESPLPARHVTTVDQNCRSQAVFALGRPAPRRCNAAKLTLWLRFVVIFRFTRGAGTAVRRGGWRVTEPSMMRADMGDRCGSDTRSCGGQRVVCTYTRCLVSAGQRLGPGR